MAYLGPSLRREKRAERPARRALAALAASVALNVALLWALALSGAFRLEPAPDSARVALAHVDAAQWEANRAVAPERQAPETPRPAPKQPPPPAPKEEEERARGQVVDVTPSEDARRPKDSRFLAEHDSTVERETKSRFANKKKYENTLPAPQEGKPGATARPRPGDGAPAQPGKPGPSGSGKAERERLALAPRPDTEGRGDLVRPRTDRDVRPQPAPGADGREPGAGQGARGGEGEGIDRRLLPDAESLARIAGGPSLDRLDGVEEGDATALNTREFKYASFINRVKNAIAQYWDPVRAYLARDPDGTMYAIMERTTEVEIVLDADGALEHVNVVQKSGLDFLDLEVVRATRAAAPFPNPPRGLVAADGKIHLPLVASLNMSRGGVQVHVVGPPPHHRAYPERDPASRPPARDGGYLPGAPR